MKGYLGYSVVAGKAFKTSLVDIFKAYLLLHNVNKNPQAPIRTSYEADEKRTQYYLWTFHVTRAWGMGKRYLHPTATLEDNRVRLSVGRELMNGYLMRVARVTIYAYRTTFKPENNEH